MKNTPLLTLFFILGITLPVSATHIVGGEITMQMMDDGRYLLALDVYYDRINTGFNVDQREPITAVHIFRKRDNQFIRTDLLTLIEAQDVVYPNSECYQAFIQTRLLTYQKILSLSPSIFDDPEGYYVVWERCCRNRVINNIVEPGNVGMVFYMEFPPVAQNGGPFFNSSPEFPFPDGSLLCLNQESRLNFAATDVDGDSLVYSLGTPWIGNTSRSLTGLYDPNTNSGAIFPTPRPYDEVVWQSFTGFNFRADQPFPYDTLFKENATQLDSFTGTLRIRPNALGLYVFNIQCDEYRDGIKIGSIRRDFQLLVVECLANTAPEVRAEYPDANGMYLNYTSGDTVSLNVRPGEACFNVYIKDPDPGQRFTVQYLPQNFVLPSSLEVMMGQMQGTGVEDSVLVPICWPECLISELDSTGNLAPFLMDVVVADNNCPFPSQDTLHLSFVAEANNQLPEISLYYPDVSGEMLLYQEGRVPNFDVREGNVCFQVVARDLDVPDNLDVLVIPPMGLEPALFPDSLAKITQGSADSLVLEYCWPECLVSDLNSADEALPFTLAALARDNNCQGLSWDTLYFDFTSEPVRNQAPSLTMSDISSVIVGESYTVDILLQDPDNDLLDLQVLPQGFAPEDWAMDIQQSGERGEIRAVIQWEPQCDQVQGQILPMAFSFQVVGRDKSLCGSQLEVVEEINLELEEKPFDDSQFQPYNVLTPNGDQRNDVFYIDNNPETREWPEENCDFQFRFIRIYNRWGNLVFRSEDPGFTWDGGDYPAGVYYYVIDYGARDYKGTLTLRR